MMMMMMLIMPMMMRPLCRCRYSFTDHRTVQHTLATKCKKHAVKFRTYANTANQHQQPNKVKVFRAEHRHSNSYRHSIHIKAQHIATALTSSQQPSCTRIMVTFPCFTFAATTISAFKYSRVSLCLCSRSQRECCTSNNHHHIKDQPASQRANETAKLPCDLYVCSRACAHFSVHKHKHTHTHIQ